MSFLLIQIWYLPDSRTPLPRKNRDDDTPSRLSIGYGPAEAVSIQFPSPINGERHTGFLKVFVSTSYVDASGFSQRSIFTKQEEADRQWENQRADRAGAALFKHPWASSVYALTTCTDLDAGSGSQPSVPEPSAHRYASLVIHGYDSALSGCTDLRLLRIS